MRVTCEDIALTGFMGTTRQPNVTLDGEYLGRVFWADDVTGEAEVASLDASGHLYAVGDRIATHMVRGKIEITFDPVIEGEGNEAHDA